MRECVCEKERDTQERGAKGDYCKHIVFMCGVLLHTGVYMLTIHTPVHVNGARSEFMHICNCICASDLSGYARVLQ